MQEIPNKPCGDGMGITCNSKRTEWSPIRSVIMRVMNKIGRSRNVNPIIVSIVTNYGPVC